jgi:antitoxin MazE
VKTRLVQIGNSKGIRLPKIVIQEAQLQDEVELQAEPGRIVICSAKRPRQDWADAARLMYERDEDRLIDQRTSTRFEREDWKWP